MIRIDVTKMMKNDDNDNADKKRENHDFHVLYVRVVKKIFWCLNFYFFFFFFFCQKMFFDNEIFAIYL